MFIELQATYLILEKWKENPELTKKEIGILSSWKEDKEKNNKPLTKKEVEDMKDFLKKYNPTAYFKLFPEEKSL